MTTEKVMAVLATLNQPGILLFMLPLKSFNEATYGIYVTYKPKKGNKNSSLIFLHINNETIKHNSKEYYGDSLKDQA